MAKAFRCRRDYSYVWVSFKADMPPVWMPPAKLNSDQCKSLAFVLLGYARAIDRKELADIQGELFETNPR